MTEAVPAEGRTASGGPRLTRLGYHPTLDGLRAIAIIYVLLDHLIGKFKGGQVGVSIFFPLSGFLITTLIIQELAHGDGSNFGFKRFWIRRTLRLFPALYTMLLVGLAYTLLMRNRDGFDVGEQLQWLGRSALYISNLGSANSHALGHTWTLGIEEQFYLVWPPILVLGVRTGRRDWLLAAMSAYAVWGLIAGWFGRFGLHNVVGPYNATLALGCVAALIREGFGGARLRDWQRRSLPRFGWAGLAVIGGAFVLGGGHPLEQDAFDRWFIALAGIAGILTMISVVERPDSRLAALLSNRAAVEVGKLSYSLYVWHGMVYWVVSWAGFAGYGGLAFRFLVSFPVAWLSYRYIERPALALKERFR